MVKILLSCFLSYSIPAWSQSNYVIGISTGTAGILLFRGAGTLYNVYVASATQGKDYVKCFDTGTVSAISLGEEKQLIYDIVISSTNWTDSMDKMSGSMYYAGRVCKFGLACIKSAAGDPVIIQAYP